MPPVAKRGRRGISPWHLSHQDLPCQEKTPGPFSFLKAHDNYSQSCLLLDSNPYPLAYVKIRK